VFSILAFSPFANSYFCFLNLRFPRMHIWCCLYFHFPSLRNPPSVTYFFRTCTFSPPTWIRWWEYASAYQIPLEFNDSRPRYGDKIIFIMATVHHCEFFWNIPSKTYNVCLRVVLPPLSTLCFILALSYRQEIITTAKNVMKVMFLPLSLCSQDSSKRRQRILAKFLKGWNVWVAKNDWKLVVIRIMTRIQKFLQEILPPWDSGNCTNFASNSKSCRRIPRVTKFLEG